MVIILENICHGQKKMQKETIMHTPLWKVGPKNIVTYYYQLEAYNLNEFQLFKAKSGEWP